MGQNEPSPRTTVAGRPRVITTVRPLTSLLLVLSTACTDEAPAPPTVPTVCGFPYSVPPTAVPAPSEPSADALPAADEPRPLDLLFVIDNSISMADKQQLLGRVANVLARFAHPPCIDAAGNASPAPAPGAACADGRRLQFEPVTDVHLGVITTSLGDGGSEVACPTQGLPRYLEDRVDMAHLLGTRPRASGAGANADGFVSWRAGDDEDAATESFANLIIAAGENGCGWEMPLEAWYRFLVDPFPYAELVRVQAAGSTSTGLNCVMPQLAADGTLLVDETLLAQRQAFLRPDSRLGIVMLSDENDCSLAVGGQSWSVLAIDDSRPFFRGSSVCETNPNDPCCYSCPLGPPDGCRADPVCNAEPNSGLLDNRLPPEADGQGLRCFQQKRRFGVDLLYPVARYVNALTQPTLCPSANDLASADCLGPVVPNPLFSQGRAPADVVLAGILGVPPDLLEAHSDVPADAAAPSGFRYKPASELTDADWAALIGDSSASPPIPPTNPFMIESVLPRDGVPSANAINGREYDTTDDLNGTTRVPDDLQYACIIPLPEPRDCTTFDPNSQACDCYEREQDRPLCEELPGVSAAGPVQYWGKAYPSTRQLEVLRGLGESGVVTSICARNTSDPTASDFSYRAAMSAVSSAMEAKLSAP